MSGTREGGLKSAATLGRGGPGLAAMRAAAKPGECIACGEPAIPCGPKAKRSHQDTCGDSICKTAWFRFWRRDERKFGRKPRHHVIPATVREDMKRGARKARQPEMTRRMVEGHRRRNAA